MMHRGRAGRRIPVMAWALVGAAALHLALWAFVNWYRIFGPYLIVKLEDLSSIVTGIAPFLLAAGALVGAVRWPAGRRWLYAGAAMSALHGVAQSASDAWWAWQVSDPIVPEGGLQVALVAGYLVENAAGALAPLLLAVGLIRAGRTRHSPALELLVPVLVGAVAVAGGLGLLAREVAAGSEVSRDQAAYVVLGVAHRIIATVGGIGFVALAIAAMLAMRSTWSGGAPEALIAAGATLAAAGLAATWIGQALLSFDEQGEQLLWVFTVPFAAASVGLVLVISGFGLAALMGRRGTIDLDGNRGSRASRRRADP